MVLVAAFVGIVGRISSRNEVAFHRGLRLMGPSERALLCTAAFDPTLSNPEEEFPCNLDDPA